ncbi:MAG: sigma-70 family RNA polymerase sigma factor [Pirellulales bacterium]
MQPIEPSQHSAPASGSSVTLLLQRLSAGDREAANELLRTIYSDLRRVAAARLSDEQSDHTFQPSDLVHEAYLRLVGDSGLGGWNSKRHFFAAAAEAMRRILIDHARHKNSHKRGGGLQRVDFPNEWIPDQHKAERLLALEEALVRLEAEAPQQAQVVKLRFFGGLTIDEVAEVLEVSATTSDRYWAYARAWLKNEMDQAEKLENL